MFSEQILFNICSPWEFVFHVLSLLQCPQLSTVYVLNQVPHVLVSVRLAMSLKIFLDQYLLFLADRLSLQSLIRSILKPTLGSLQMYSPPLSEANQKPSHLLTVHLSHSQHETVHQASPAAEPKGISLQSSLMWYLSEGRALQLSKTLELF